MHNYHYYREYGLKQNRTIGIYPELKHSFAVNKVRIEDVLVLKLNIF